MRGEIEIYEGDKLLYSEPNMLVDGAGALLADIMTVSPSLSGIADTATSSILDSSNYTIQAISFGTSKLGLMGNAQYMDTSTNPTTGAQDPAYKWAGIWDPTHLGGKPVGNIKSGGPTALVYSPDMAASPYDTSTYVPLVGLPTPPDPSLSALEMTGYHEGQGVNATVSALVGGFPTEDMPGGDLNLLEPTPLSSLFPGPGQLVNTMPSAISEHIFQNTAFSANSVPLGNQRYFLPSCFLGAFPQGSSTECADLPRGSVTRGGTRVLIFPSYDWSLQVNEADATYDFTYSGIFNEASSMDASGFVTMVMSATPQDAATTPGADYTYEISSTYSGLCLSGSDDLSNNGTILILLLNRLSISS